MVMNVLYRGFIAELGILYLPFDTPVLPVVPFCIYQVGQQFIRCVIIRFTRLKAWNMPKNFIFRSLSSVLVFMLFVV
jgi:hypothetical protein